VLPLPFALARAGLRLARRRARAAWLEVLRYDLVLDTSRARRRLGWKPHYDSVKACLRAAADGREQTCDR
jgi:nucleoside-diphosphate-sugar epimerase